MASLILHPAAEPISSPGRALPDGRLRAEVQPPARTSAGRRPDDRQRLLGQLRTHQSPPSSTAAKAEIGAASTDKRHERALGPLMSRLLRDTTMVISKLGI
jgi:hypothetical protein